MDKERIWHVVERNRSASELTDTTLRQRILDGSVTGDTLVWWPGMVEWQLARTVPGLFTPPPPPSEAEERPIKKAPPPVPELALSAQPSLQDAPPLRASRSDRVLSGSEESPLEPSQPRQSAQRRRSYLVRHWRGELGLGISYWVNGTLLGMFLGGLTGAAGAIDITQAPRLFSFTFASLTLLIIFVSIWQLVGIWRSAGRNIEEQHGRGRKAPWSGAARVSTVLGFMGLFGTTVTNRVPSAWAYLQIAFGGDPTPHHLLRLLNGGKEVEIAGGIDFGTAADFETLLNASSNVQTVDLNSVGGRVAEAEKIRDLIRSHHLATYTAAACASACTVIYMGGYPRYLGPDGKLAFHRYAFPGLSAEQDGDVNRQGQQELVSSGVDSAFAEKAFSTPSSGLWMPDRSTLLASHVVTQIVDGMSFSSAAVEENMTRETVDQELSSNRTFSALKKAEPGLYAQAVQGIVDGVHQGRSLHEVTVEAHESVLSAVARYRPMAPDDVQVQIAAVTADEARLLAPSHPDACMELLVGSAPQSVSYTQWLPKDLQDRENGITADIINGGSFRPSQVIDTKPAADAMLVRLWGHVRAAGFDISTVGRTPTSTDEQKSSCLAFSEFFRELSALPPAQAGPLMRYLDTSS